MKRTWLWVTIIVLVLAAAIAAIWYFMRPQAAQLECTDNAGVTVYGDGNYGGTSACFPIGNYNASGLLSKNITNDSISSIKVPAGYRITVYFTDNFGETTSYSREFSKDVPNLGSIPRYNSSIGINMGTVNGNWNDEISSIKVSTALACDITAYSAADYNETSPMACFPAGDYRRVDLIRKGLVGNDAISSIKVSTGSKVTVFDQDNFDGASHDFTADISNLNSVSKPAIGLGIGIGVWDNQILSLKVVKTTEPETPTGECQFIETDFNKLLFGDLDCNGTVNAVDLSVIRANFLRNTD